MSELSGYFCVFIGRPSLCYPYAMFATEEQAVIFNKNFSSKYKIMTYEKWVELYDSTDDEGN